MQKEFFATLLVLVGCATSSNGDDDLPPLGDGVATLAGSADPGFIDGDRNTARFADPVNVAFAPDGRIVVADFDNSKLRVVDSQGNTTTLINQKNFQRPFGLLFVGDTLWVSTDNDPNGGHDLMSGSIWKVDIDAMTATPVATRLGRPRSLAALSDGRIATADDLHHVIQIFDPRTAQMTMLAGTWGTKGMVDATGTAARFSTPYNIVQRGDGKLIVADFDNNRLRLVGLDGSVSTLAGTGTAGFADGAAASAQLNHPQAIVMTSDGTVFFTDLGNARVRRLAGGNIDTVAGNGTAGWQDNADPLQAELFGLEGISANPDGSMLYVADGTRGEAVPFNRIRQIKM
jgi:DNA-binding beta-propeller fold protein YncE